MTVSFSIPFSCRPNTIEARVCYTKQNSLQHDCVSAKVGDVKQYNHTSTVSGEIYMSDWIYHIGLQGLRGRSMYFYNVVIIDANNRETDHSNLRHRHRHIRDDTILDDFIMGASSLLNFTTAPTYVDLNRNDPSKIAFLGDLGQTINSTMTMRNILQRSQVSHEKKEEDNIPITLALCVGDMSYADSNQTLWDTWLTLMEPMLAHLPFHVVPGNHEIECDGKTHVPFLAYENRFRMPNRIGDAFVLPVDEYYFHTEYGCSAPSVFLGDYDFGNAFYSFDHGLAHIIILSSYSDTRIGSNQYRWLEKDLADVNRVQKPWLIVAMHTQFYTTFKGHNNETQTTQMREIMEDLFLHYKVNLIVSGHDHAYMRSKSLFHGIFDESEISPIYIIVGEGGNKEGHVKDYINEEQESWVASRDKTVFGFGALTIHNNTHSHWTWIMDESLDQDKFTDDFWFFNSIYL